MIVESASHTGAKVSVAQGHGEVEPSADPWKTRVEVEPYCSQ